MPRTMSKVSEPSYGFKDAEDHVQIDLPELSNDVTVNFTGDSLQLKSSDGSKDLVFEVPQLYSTIDVERSRLEVRAFHIS